MTKPNCKDTNNREKGKKIFSKTYIRAYLTDITMVFLRYFFDLDRRNIEEAPNNKLKMNKKHMAPINTFAQLNNILYFCGMKKIYILLVMAGCILLSSCDILNDMMNQANSLANLKNCEFNLKNVNNVNVAGVNVKNLSQGKLTAADVVKLVAAYQSKQVPLTMNVNMDVKNPTTQEAALSVLDWILAIDGKDMASGTNTQRYTIKPSTTSTVPLGVSTDLGDMFSQKGLEALKTFASSFTNEGISSKVGLKVRPSLVAGNTTIPFPSYFTLEKKTGNG